MTQSIIWILFLAFVQNVAFTIVSRSRNRDNMRFHLVAALFSNSIWFLTFRLLVKSDMTLYLFPTYCIGTMAGSVYGARLSMTIERWLGATADGHLKKKPDPELVAAVAERVIQMAGLEPHRDPEPAFIDNPRFVAAVASRVAEMQAVGEWQQETRYSGIYYGDTIRGLSNSAEDRYEGNHDGTH